MRLYFFRVEANTPMTSSVFFHFQKLKIFPFFNLLTQFNLCTRYIFAVSGFILVVTRSQNNIIGPNRITPYYRHYYSINSSSQNILLFIVQYIAFN